ncbi:MAG: Ig-like domain-containing protein [Bacteroides sp.]|nr:Ig-like domain-containing protein [Bacteroides sp.]
MKKEVSWLFKATLLMFLSVGVFTSCDDDDEDNTEDNTQQDVSVTGVSLNVSSLSLLPGGSYTFTATVTPENATNQTVTWSCSDEDIAQLTDNEDGTATITVSDEAEEENECTVTVTTEDGGFTAECMVTVITEEIEETEAEIVEVSLNLDAGEESDAYTGIVSLATDGTLNLQLKALKNGTEITEGITWSAAVDVNGYQMDLVSLGIMNEDGLIQIPEEYIEFLTGGYAITLIAMVDADADSPYTLRANITEGGAEGEYTLTITSIVYEEVSLNLDGEVESDAFAGLFLLPQMET